MHAGNLSFSELIARLRSLVTEGRRLDVEFLLHLAELERRRGFAELGYPHLWEFCRQELGLLDGAIFRRVHAARILAAHPDAAEFLRDGRLSMTTLVMLEDVLTPENARGVFERAARKSKRDVDSIVAGLRAPRPEPFNMIRKLPALAGQRRAGENRLGPESEKNIEAALNESGNFALAPVFPASPKASRESVSTSVLASEPGSDSVEAAPASAATASASPAASPTAIATAATAMSMSPTAVANATAAAPELDSSHGSSALPARPPSRPRINAAAEDRFTIRVTVSRDFMEKFERAKSVLSHVEPTGDLARVLERALDQVIEKAERKHAPKAMRPARSAAKASAAPATAPVATAADSSAERAEASHKRKAIPAEVAREVWTRDGGACTWRMKSGERCGSTWQPELDHIVPVAKGGASTVENLRVLCRGHNDQHARDEFGDERMNHFRKSTSPGRSDAARRPSATGRSDKARAP